jgi:hypothetical protein
VGDAGAGSAADDALLSWEANPEPSVSGYNLYVGTTSRGYGTPIDVGSRTTYTLAGLGSGTYYFAVTAYDAGGAESDYSNEVSKTLQ